MWETWSWSLGLEDPLEKGMATHSSITAWRSPWTKDPGEPQSTGSQRVRQHWVTSTLTFGYYRILSRQHWVTSTLTFGYYGILSRVPWALGPCCSSIFKYSNMYTSIKNRHLSLPATFFLGNGTYFPKSLRLLLFLNKFICILVLRFCIYVISYNTYLSSDTLHLVWQSPCSWKWHYLIPFHGGAILHHICVPHRQYPFNHQWTFRLLPCLGCCKECCSEPCCCASFQTVFFPSGYTPRRGTDKSYSSSIYFLRKPPHSSPEWPHRLHSCQLGSRFPFFCAPFSIYRLCVF